ncbi:hypothetical protein BDR07DRAFT_887046 [Suillus spraguei]|nr:hypothetical protein BDR07DRAFT_887046 [Suillus spraguei]
MAVDQLHVLLDNLNASRFASCRLHSPCIAFRVTAVKRSRGQDQEIYEVKANGLHDLLITTKDTLIQFSSPRPTMQTFFLFVRGIALSQVVGPKDRLLFWYHPLVEAYCIPYDYLYDT